MEPFEDRNHDLLCMNLALEQARRAAALGDVPVGAVIVWSGRVIARSHNMREIYQDPTAHAEILALRAAAQQLESWRLLDATIYVTLEPCPMCVGAMVLARLARVVYGAADPKGGACGSLMDLPGLPGLNHRLRVTGGLRSQESQHLLQTFFRERRKPEEGPLFLF